MVNTVTHYALNIDWSWYDGPGWVTSDAYGWGVVIDPHHIKKAILTHSNPHYREYIRQNPVIWNDLFSKVHRRVVGEKDQLDDIFGPQSGGRRKNNRLRYY